MGLTTLIVVVVLLLHQTCNISTAEDYCTSSCGSILNISKPFRLTSDSENCGDQRYNLSCENNQTLVLHLHDGRYYVRQINYTEYTIKVVDPGIGLNANEYYSFIPRYSLEYNNFSSRNPYQLGNSMAVYFVKCEKRVNSRYHLNISACFEGGVYSSKRYTYALFQYNYHSAAVELGDLCQVEQISLISWRDRYYYLDLRNISCTDFHNDLLQGFELYWGTTRFGKQGILQKIYLFIARRILLQVLYFVSNRLPVPLGQRLEDRVLQLKGRLYELFGRARPIPLLTYLTIIDYGLIFPAAKMILGTPFVIAFLMYKWRRRHLSMYNVVEEFLQSHNNLMPIRYSYSEIKKITKSFKEKLGEGGYGTVFKGTLRSGRLVAIKMLGKSKANGQDFISEVATIGRIHHVNIVQLIGFCVEGSKRALVYEFMPNGSLNKYIFLSEVHTLLSYDQMFDIALGVARGIEYLHQGCDMQILHFDIKPHNILLDENFTPKVSDFGLAKLYPVNDSIVSLTAARGTLGYMAPELFYKNIGGVSFKADVYSFGMLLMEMAGRRKNVNAFAEHSSQTYFPTWVYNQLQNGNDVEILEDATEEEKKMGKKMIIVALWCIQMKPNDRPSMSKVIQMLEGKVECLQMPSKPFLSSLDETVIGGGENSNPSNESSQSSQF
ncbi:rust resistance kinase Lr10-like isoform X1 [Alnus glutinosa]|uniref:rust resistance kinase Lr10-like isoform X1 n=1 Tax=Alnus glutinosa TaxID=3517 RepID=UPI002D78D34A|nr:rust resistance kinase Lr10-like isoform X1 [Alnus glutinosa]